MGRGDLIINRVLSGSRLFDQIKALVIDRKRSGQYEATAMKTFPSTATTAAPLALTLLVACGGHTSGQDAGLSAIEDGGGIPQDAMRSDAPGFLLDPFDDWEDGDRDIIPAGGRFGHWYNYDDQTVGTSLVAVVSLDLTTERHKIFQTVSTMALRVQANGYDKWGSGFGADVAAGKPYDVSAYTGLVLWAKNLSPNPSVVRVVISDVNTDPKGGICDMSPSAPAETACFDSYGRNLELTSDWQMYLMPFWTLKQGGFGLTSPTGFDTRQIIGISFANNFGATYDYYIDDIAFYRE
jgi:hypothetical protein